MTRPPVFIIDDEEVVRSSLGRLLRIIGVQSKEYASAEAFLTSFVGPEQACLLIDIRMPGMSGLELMEELDRRRTPMPAIVMTGHADEQSLQRLRALRPIGLLQKPFSVTDLKALLEGWWSTLDPAVPS